MGIEGEQHPDHLGRIEAREPVAHRCDQRFRVGHRQRARRHHEIALHIHDHHESAHRNLLDLIDLELYPYTRAEELFRLKRDCLMLNLVTG